MNSVRVLVVDDHALFRRGLVSLLKEMSNILVVGEAADGSEAIKAVDEISPDVILLDVNMPGQDGIETVKTLRAKKFQGSIIMLTISRHEEDLLGAITAGADGYLLKNVEPAELQRAIVRVAEGKGVLSPEVTKKVLKAVRSPTDQRESGGISQREREVLQYLAKGNTTAQIAAQLFISENTVKTHIRHILEKLEASNRTEAVSKAVQLGLIRQDL